MSVRNLYILCLLALAFACSKPAPQQVALRTAKAYYDQLLQGDYAAFVAGTEGYDSIPESFREQLTTNAKMFLAQQKAEHKGIDSISAMHATTDSILWKGEKRLSAEAYLTICYSDSMREQIVVPMVEMQGVWMMR